VALGEMTEILEPLVLNMPCRAERSRVYGRNRPRSGRWRGVGVPTGDSAVTI